MCAGKTCCPLFTKGLEELSAKYYSVCDDMKVQIILFFSVTYRPLPLLQVKKTEDFDI